ncbi:MAG: FHA domain-containing protein [Coriobacteriia bacterium]|nr:FHA domain-containing protein [Coriobacteriia bacterium]
MNYGQTYIEINYNSAWVDQALQNIQGFSWLFQWGMYLFLLATLAICIWIFFDSIYKHKGQKAMVPRILSIVGVFLILPAFIFRFTGNADAVTTLVRLGAEPGTPYYTGAINWNVNWLVSGYGVPIAAIALVGVVVSVVALVMYMSMVNRTRPETKFVNAIDDLQRKVDQMPNQKPATAPVASSPHSSVADAVKAATGPNNVVSANSSSAAKTVFDSKPQAATVIDVPMSSATLNFTSGANAGLVVPLPLSSTILGRDTNCNVVINDVKVTSRHARINNSGNDWVLTDLGSTNGTFVNSARITGPQTLNTGDTVRMGDTTFTFSTGE